MTLQLLIFCIFVQQLQQLKQVILWTVDISIWCHQLTVVSFPKNKHTIVTFTHNIYTKVADLKKVDCACIIKVALLILPWINILTCMTATRMADR